MLDACGLINKESNVKNTCLYISAAICKGVDSCVCVSIYIYFFFLWLSSAEICTVNI